MGCWRLFTFLALIGAVPLVAATLLVIDHLATEQSKAQRDMLEATTRALAAAVNAEYEKYAVLGHSLRTSVLLDQGNLQEFYQRALQAASDLPGAWVVLANAEGQQLLNTRRKFGDPLPMVVPLESHRQALKTGLDQLGGVEIGPVVQRPALGLFVPVKKEDQSYTIVIGLDPHIFTRVLERQRLPDGWLAGISDPQG